MSIKQKDSRLSARLRKIGREPPLASAYRHAVEYVCHEYTTVPNSQYPRFIKRQKILDKHSVAYDTYAYSVVKVWWKWCKSKAMRTVPANLFCGDKAWQRFQEQHKTVTIANRHNDIHSRMVHDELCVGRAYIGWNIAQFMPRGVTRSVYASISYNDVNGLCLSTNLINTPTRPPDVRQEVICLLAGLYNCEAESYDDIVEALRVRNA